MRLCIILFLLLSWFSSAALLAAPLPGSAAPKLETSKVHHRPRIDYSGKIRTGKASYYSRKFSRKTMADGTRMNPNSDSAASRTLPLGTKARVTNLHNGKTAVVVIKDRGPYVRGRIIDVSPQTAKELGLGKHGVARVEVAPIEVPQPDGSVREGAGAADAR